MSEQNRKTLRSFYCRDYLWDLFEVMTRDLGCSMDYLINEAMRHYARSRNYSLTGAGAAPERPPAPGGYQQQPYEHGGQAGGMPSGRGAEHPTFERMPAMRQSAPAPRPYASAPPPAPPPPSSGGYQQHRMAPPPPPPPPTPQHQQYSAPPPPPPPPQPRAMEPAAAAGRRPLYLIFNNQRYVIDKEKFIIGRGSTMTDLTIRDGNISRKHAAVIFRNGQYYIKDLDSTNGIDYRGSRIDSKKIEEADVFNICDYELRFTYH